MAKSERQLRGEAEFTELYGDSYGLPPGYEADDFATLMLQQLYGEIWPREVLSVRDRRLLLVGALCALGEAETLEIIVRAALAKGEFQIAQLREVAVFIVPYVGYGRARGIKFTIEKVIAEAAAAS